MCVCVYCHPIFILDVRLVGAPAGVTQEEGRTRFLHLLSAVLALFFIASIVSGFAPDRMVPNQTKNVRNQFLLFLRNSGLHFSNHHVILSWLAEKCGGGGVSDNNIVVSAMIFLVTK